MRKFHALALGVVIAGAAAAVAIAAPGGSSGPSSSQSPYLVRSQPGVVLKSILTVGDSVNNKPDGVTPYRMVGIPDGLGAFDNGDGTFTVLMNHELGSSVGVTRAHGAKGAFVSKWTIRKDDLTVLHGEDLIQNLIYSSGTKAMNRLCSADLPPFSAFSSGGMGYDGRIFMNGEESGTEGRAFAHVVTGPEAGTSYELPYLGKFAWENAVAHPDPGAKTVVVGMDDGPGNQVYVYVGDKTTTGTAPQKAGLTGGKLYGVKVVGLGLEADTSVVDDNTAVTLVDQGYVNGLSGVELDNLGQYGTKTTGATKTYPVTSFQRPEDGAWDTKDPTVFYFVTTASFTGNSKLWKLDFVDPTNPAAGATISVVASTSSDGPNLPGGVGPRMMDNLTVNARGQVVI